MGNSNPANPKLNIHIQTEKPYYNSGSNIEGVVFVDAKDVFHFDALYIRVEGDQYCQWFEGSSKNRRKYTGNENFYAIQHMLTKFKDSTLHQGKFAYPFSLQLSENIPGSFYSNQYQAKIQYKLIAYCANFHDPKLRHQHEVPLFIRQPFRQEPCEYQGSVTKSPVTCWCFNKGQTYLRVRFGKNVSFQRQNVQIQIEADNERGKSPILDFVVQLVNYTFVSSNSGVFRIYRNLVHSQRVGRKVESGQKILPFDYEFQIPSVKHQTAISTLVANYYRLQVYADIAAISQDQPSVYSPLFVMKSDYPEIKEQNLEGKVEMSDYVLNKKHIFKAPEYWFRKNKNLQVMNFRLEDGIGPENENENMVMN